MQRYALMVSYDGTRYSGWQRQPAIPSVAGTIEGVLERLLGRAVRLTGAGRTDAGVHAYQQVAHWEIDRPLPHPFLPRLNALLPSDIRALALYQTAPEFHARHSAQKRTYRYYIHWVPNPFKRSYSFFLPQPLPLSLLRGAASLLVGTHEFSAFTRDLKSQTRLDCHIFHTTWEQAEEGSAFFEIQANRFLRGMVRALVGAQIRLAQGKLKWETFLSALTQGDRRWGMYLAPPQGLFLWRVEYPPNLLYLLEGYDSFWTATGTASAYSPEPTPNPTGSSLRGTSGGAGEIH
ncbi:MAG: tRNA pseudouridine(38-40) synthase TruA [Bacteroidia bacterium]|nr:tRNA pseudouridine(38-40) synthase TruA [Bacteroidia bacterium]MDW8014676.1 tRNA pseudouridine(38-40) synthase TruA [Bacteroidia bacterium]